MKSPQRVLVEIAALILAVIWVAFGLGWHEANRHLELPDPSVYKLEAIHNLDDPQEPEKLEVTCLNGADPTFQPTAEFGTIVVGCGTKAVEP